MNDMKNMIDSEIGKDTEHHRVTLLKYVSYGRRLEREELAANGVPQYTEEQMQAAIKTKAFVVATEIFSELHAIMADAAIGAEFVERTVEKERFAEFKKQAADGPIKAEMLEKFAGLLESVDKAHTAVIRIRDAAIEALKAKYTAQV